MDKRFKLYKSDVTRKDRIVRVQPGPDGVPGWIGTRFWQLRMDYVKNPIPDRFANNKVQDRDWIETILYRGYSSLDAIYKPSGYTRRMWGRLYRAWELFGDEDSFYMLPDKILSRLKCRGVFRRTIAERPVFYTIDSAVRGRKTGDREIVFIVMPLKDDD